MNKERLETLALWLEGGAKHDHITFDMAEGIVFKRENFDPDTPTACNTSCCIAGAAVQFFDPAKIAQLARDAWFSEDDPEDDTSASLWIDVEEQAAELLGLPLLTADELFVPNRGSLREYNDPAWAARVIRHLIETGEVDWESNRNPAPVGSDMV